MRNIFFTLFFLFPLSNYAFTLDNSNGHLVLTEVYDYQCPHCRAEFPIIKRLLHENPTLKLRLLPAAVINQTSLIEAASIYAVVNNKNYFHALNQAYFTWPITKPNEVLHLLQRFGLFNLVLQRQMHSNKVKHQLQQSLQLLQRFHSGVPLLILSRDSQILAVYRGETSFSNLQTEVHDDLAHD